MSLINWLFILFDLLTVLGLAIFFYVLWSRWVLKGQVFLSPQEAAKLREAFLLETRKREELEREVKRLYAQVDLLTNLLHQLNAGHQDKIQVVRNGKSLDRAFVSNAPMNVVGAWPQNVKAAPLDLERDFSNFINSGGHWNYRALKGHVPFSQLIKEFRRMVRSDRTIAIFYAACHGDDRGLLFSDGWAEPRKLADLMVLGQVKLVILASCKTNRVADAMRRAGVPAVIYMSNKILDKDAIALSGSIIAGLADGLSLEKAVAFAKSEMRDKAVAHAILRLTTGHDFSDLTKSN